MKKGNVYIGTSGWSYKHWIGKYYPAGTTGSAQLNLYCRDFSTVELNNSFYRLPDRTAFSKWRTVTPDDFIFAVKASRYITHMKKLKDPEEPLERMMSQVIGLGHKLGPILFQLPPTWKVNLPRFSYFLSMLPNSARFAFEFRDPSWYDDAVTELLLNHGCAFCIYELDGHVSPHHVTADFVYVRLHGPGERYAGSYSDKVLDRWASQVRDWSGDGLHVFVYFDNDQQGHAAFNALRLKELMKQ